MTQSGELDLSTIPNLPGFSLRRKPKVNHKSQAFHVVDGLRCEKPEGAPGPLLSEKPKTVRIPRQPDDRRVGSTFPESTTQETYKETQKWEATVVPAGIYLDRVVLRFYGFFREAVAEANFESYRIRHAIIYYYLEDDTCHVVEKKQDNSGIPQGQLIRRHRFPGQSGGDYLRWEELQVRGQLHVYGKSIYIYDCDEFTRQYCEQNGAPQAPADQPEVDAFAASRNIEQGPLGIPKTHEKLYREVQLGGGHVNENMQQFLEWDGKVCRFFAVMDDVATQQFERRPFALLYFLADDTMEIREQYPFNCGRDCFPIFFRRNRMPRGPTTVTGPLEQPLSREEFLHVSELSVGVTHNLGGYKLFIYDADSFTRKYFDENLGQNLGPKVDVRLPDRTVPRPPTPPYAGYGSWDDSLGSVYSLVPKPPRKDFDKLYYQDGKVLRYTARFLNPGPEHVHRIFVVNYHLFDDTLSIHEPPQRNSGIVTGKYLEKGVHANQMTGKLFQKEDLALGAIIKVYNTEFVILDMDDYTQNYLADSDAARSYDLDALLEKLRESMRQQFPLVRDIFRKFDADHNGVITRDEFREALRKWGFQPSEQDVLTLMRHFDMRRDGQIGYNAFCDALLDEDYTTRMLKPRRGLEQAPDPGYADRAAGKLEERAENDRVRHAARAIGDVVYKHTQVFQKLFKEFAIMTHGDTVSVAQIQAALKQIGFTFELEDVRRAVLYVLPGTDLERVNYIGFLKATVSSYHEMGPTR